MTLIVRYPQLEDAVLTPWVRGTIVGIAAELVWIETEDGDMTVKTYRLRWVADREAWVVLAEEVA